MAIYHKATNVRAKRGDTVYNKGIALDVHDIFEYERRGAGVMATQKHSTIAHFREYLCSEVDCFHSTGEYEIFNNGR